MTRIRALVSIRDFKSEDYEALVEIDNVNFPDHPSSLEEWRFWDENRDPKCRWRRWVAESDEVVLGYGGYSQYEDMFHPRKFQLELGVHPSHQRQGIGSFLYLTVLKNLESLDPISLRAWAKEDMNYSCAFLERRGFINDMRVWESRLDVANFDFTPYAGLSEKLESEGFQIRTLDELRFDPERDLKLYELQKEISWDVPIPEERTEISLAIYEKWLKDPDLLPDAFFIMVCEGEYVGLSNLRYNPKSPDLFQGLTGVKRAFRRKGLALALKLRGIAYAREHGCPGLRTNNESMNEPILNLNRRLGFVRQPAWISYKKTLGEE